MFSFDIASAIVKAVAEWKAAKRAHAWGRLVFSMIFSGVVSFYGVAGAARIAEQSEIVADGMGMLAVAVSLLGLFTKSNLTRGMTISVPSSVTAKMHEASTTTIKHT